MIIERSIQIVTRTHDPKEAITDTGVQVYLRVGEVLVETGIAAPDEATAARLVADRLAGRV